MRYPQGKDYFTAVYQAAKDKNQNTLSDLIPKEIITVDLKDALGNTVAGKLAFEGDLESAKWLHQKAWASPHGIVQGAARNPTLQKEAHELFKRYDTHPIWFIQGLAFSGDETELNNMVHRYIREIHDGRVGLGIDYHGVIAAHMILNRQEALYKKWRAPLIENALIGQEESNNALLCIARALGVTGDAKIIEEFLQWLPPLQQTYAKWSGNSPLYEFDRKQIVLRIYRGLAQGGHNVADYTVLDMQESPYRALLPLPREANLTRILGYAASGNFTHCQRALSEYALTESRMDFNQIAPSQKMAVQTFFEFGYQAMGKALASHYLDSDILQWDMAPDIFSESMIRGYIPHLVELTEMPSFESFLSKLEHTLDSKIDQFSDALCPSGVYEGEDSNIPLFWSSKAAAYFLEHIRDDVIVNKLYSLAYNSYRPTNAHPVSS